MYTDCMNRLLSFAVVLATCCLLLGCVDFDSQDPVVDQEGDGLLGLNPNNSLPAFLCTRSKAMRSLVDGLMRAAPKSIVLCTYRVHKIPVKRARQRATRRRGCV